MGKAWSGFFGVHGPLSEGSKVAIWEELSNVMWVWDILLMSGRVFNKI